MQKQIEFIREKVVMANNPECKTLEEALEKEVKLLGCLVDCDMQERGYIMPKRKILTVSAYNKYNERFVIEPVYIKTFRVWGKREENGSYKNGTFYTDKILGLPLTLERVLVALHSESIYESYNSYSHGVWRIWFYSKTKKYTEWQPNKTLEQQSEETIKVIAEVLGFKE